MQFDGSSKELLHIYIYRLFYLVQTNMNQARPATSVEAILLCPTSVYCYRPRKAYLPFCAHGYDVMHVIVYVVRHNSCFFCGFFRLFLVSAGGLAATEPLTHDIQRATILVLDSLMSQTFLDLVYWIVCMYVWIIYKTVLFVDVPSSPIFLLFLVFRNFRNSERKKLSFFVTCIVF